jgi:hypothetical protein
MCSKFSVNFSMPFMQPLHLLLPVAACSLHDVLRFTRSHYDFPPGHGPYGPEAAFFLPTSINSITPFHLCDNPGRLIFNNEQLMRLRMRYRLAGTANRLNVDGNFVVNPLCETTFDECGSRNVECGRMESLRSVFF